MPGEAYVDGAVHTIAVYLEHEFPDWHTDCEFNRQGQNRVPKSVGQILPHLKESKKGSGLARVYPDIIVHRRRKGQNLLAVEVKPSGSKGLKRDTTKLRKYLVEPDLKYTFAALVTYDTRTATFDRVLPLTRMPKGYRDARQREVDSAHAHRRRPARRARR
jgi:hypothetical protein